MQGKGEGLSAGLIFRPREPGQTVNWEEWDPDFNCQIDLQLSDGII